MIAIGNIDASKIYLGSEEISKIYLGGEQVWGDTPLPYDAQVEYLEGGTTQYIDTGIQPDLNMRAILTASGIQGASGATFGARVALNNSMFTMHVPSGNDTGKVRFDFAAATHGVSGYLNDRHSYGLIGDQRRAVIDSVKVTDCYGTTLTCSFSVHLFGYNDGGTHVYRNSDMKVYGFSLWNSGTKIMGLIPVRVGQIGYMYDTIGKQLYGNAGTGSFGFGNDVTT